MPDVSRDQHLRCANAHLNRACEMAREGDLIRALGHATLARRESAATGLVLAKQSVRHTNECASFLQDKLLRQLSGTMPDASDPGGAE